MHYSPAVSLVNTVSGTVSTAACSQGEGFDSCTDRSPVVMDATRVPGATADTREGEKLWIRKHPRFREMMSLDAADSAQVYAAFLVYMDLLEARNWYDVQISSSADLHLIYLRGQEKDDHKPQVIIPTPVSTSHSHESIFVVVVVKTTSLCNILNWKSSSIHYFMQLEFHFAAIVNKPNAKCTTGFLDIIAFHVQINEPLHLRLHTDPYRSICVLQASQTLLHFMYKPTNHGISAYMLTPTG
ncbi:tRNA-splicing endonuclease subunit Sen15 [Pelobates cultripes]|uniref:tRNA-splicing endonuclease subunit Sen15 n=1 Tax=Pelobates cultripes TaxID=61616 RepID=A0AAD1WHZ7_PELCU|nr:tRNA-splicing endonuclease subunit Sen15 [Pelobates cultripes]